MIPKFATEARQSYHVIIDADSYLHRAARKFEGVTGATVHDALDVVNAAIEALLLNLNASSFEAHITGDTSTKRGRFNLATHKPYQGNRKGKERPALLGPLKLECAKQLHWYMHEDVEADDAILDSVRSLKRPLSSVVVVSADKDLCVTPSCYLDLTTMEMHPHLEAPYMGYIALDGKRKIKGRGSLFFWAQALMGDTADNISGLHWHPELRSVGPVKAYTELQVCVEQYASESELYQLAKVVELVLAMYKEGGQDPWPELEALYLGGNAGLTLKHMMLGELQQDGGGI